MSVTVDYNNFKIMQYHEYNIMYTDVINDTRMYLISEIVDKFSKVNNVRKDLYDYLRLSSTKDFIRVLINKCVTGNSRSRINIENISIKNTIKINNKNIDGIVHVVNIANSIVGFNSKCHYLFNEYLFNDCLLWLDKIFAFDVIHFLIQCRNIDNNCLKEQIEGLVYKVNDLENKNEDLNSQLMLVTKNERRLLHRYVEDKIPNNWKLTIIPGFENNKFELRLIYRKTNSTYMSENNLVTICKLPNANVIRTVLFPRFLNLLANYGGIKKNKQRSRIILPLERYSENNLNVLTLDQASFNNPISIKPSSIFLQKLKELFENTIVEMGWTDTIFNVKEY